MRRRRASHKASSHTARTHQQRNRVMLLTRWARPPRIQTQHILQTLTCRPRGGNKETENRIRHFYSHNINNKGTLNRKNVVDIPQDENRDSKGPPLPKKSENQGRAARSYTVGRNQNTELETCIRHTAVASTIDKKE